MESTLLASLRIWGREFESSPVRQFFCETEGRCYSGSLGFSRVKHFAVLGGSCFRIPALALLDSVRSLIPRQHVTNAFRYREPEIAVSPADPTQPAGYVLIGRVEFRANHGQSQD